MEIKIIILVLVVLSLVMLVVCVRVYEIGKFVNNRKIDEIFNYNIQIYDLYKDVCCRHGVHPKRHIPVEGMLKEVKRIIEESNNEEDTNVYVDKF